MSTPSNWAVDLTLVILLALSIATWSIAAIKLRKFRALRRLNETFLKSFSKERDWQKACQMAKDSRSECAQVALEAFMTCKELDQEQGGQVDLNDAQQLLERELHKTLQIFNRRREKGLTELASIGSTAPFIGLFGTVWGIMNALVTISATGQASIDVVAGPIGEALIATAIGIATAVPAVLAYNYFLRQQRVLSGELSEFAEDFLRFAIRNHKRWSESC
jgi:biopolymer transport protein ExbB